MRIQTRETTWKFSRPDKRNILLRNLSTKGRFSIYEHMNWTYDREKKKRTKRKCAQPILRVNLSLLCTVLRIIILMWGIFGILLCGDVCKSNKWPCIEWLGNSSIACERCYCRLYLYLSGHRVGSDDTVKWCVDRLQVIRKNDFE